MRALVLGGAGAVCREATRDLALNSSFEEIVVADANLTSVEELLREIGDDRLKPLAFDADDDRGMPELFRSFDVVVNGLPFEYDLPVTRACVEVGVNGLDLSSEEPQYALHDEAVSKDLIFIPGVGATPGTTNMMIAQAAEVLDRLDEVEIFFAAFRCLAPSPGLLETTLWEFAPEEEDRLEAYFEDGEWQSTPPLSGGIEVRFHEQIGIQRVYYVPHDEAKTIPISYPNLRRVAVRGCFPPHVMELMGSLMRNGFLTSKAVTINGHEVPAIEVVRALLWENPITKHNPVWAYGLVVEVLGERDERQVRCIYRNDHPPQEVWGGTSAYYKNIGLPLAVGANLIAAGKVTARGVLPPEQALPVEPFFVALAQRGILVEEQILEEGQIVESGQIGSVS